jgi:cyanophycinase-like exopeptidase
MRFMSKGVLALLGSGETAPGMTKVHRQLLKRLDEVRAVNLDTAYGFQENVPQMTEKLLNYFQTSLHVAFEPLHFISYEHASELERTLFKQQVRAASYVFAGPGSPSYAMAQWQPLELIEDLNQVLLGGGTLCFSSAAAATVGAFCPPIYEIYKVGVLPYWLAGLNIMATLGLNCVVIPHYDNQEGANYDTSRCYLGERRLALMEKELPPGVATLGVDEHTALVIDLEADSIQVLGKSHGYWRLNGEVRVLENGSNTPLQELRTLDVLDVPIPAAPVVTTASQPADLAQVVLDGGEGAVAALAQLVQLGATGGEGFIDPAPLVEGVLAARVNARASGQYELADELRDALVKAGIDVQDTPQGTTWSLRVDD